MDPRVRSSRRLQLAAICLGLTVLVFSQAAGLEAADTKLDLVVSPWRFLAHSLTMWDSTASAGQLQDQAYGYLFPMGPFFLLGHWMHLPPWITQRLWESVLVVTAFLGTVRLSRLLGVKGFWPRVAAGLAYALAPRMLMEIGVISSELLPVVVAPWVLIPLVRGARTGSPRRAAAASGVALLFASGINATATLAILPLPALWLLTRQRGRRRAALMRWWVLSVFLACLWWVIPLIVLGKYGSPFLDWIESSAVTTGQTSLVASLRGAEHWQAYLGPGVWPAGWDFVSARAIVLATALVAVAGVVGIALRRTPHRVFLASSLGLGLVLVTFGHVATVGPLFAGHERLALDGTLNAFRNIHKFDPVIRLPLAIGLGSAVSAVGGRMPALHSLRWRRRTLTYAPAPLVAMVAVAMAVIAVAPAVGGELVPQTRSVNEPAYWTQAGHWLGEHPGRTLVVPGAAQPVYVWGSPRDDALQPVADGEWSVRDAAPQAQPGYVRLLDEIETRLSDGQPDPQLASLLASAGIRYVMVRRDLDTRLSGSTSRLFIDLTLEGTPGFTKVAQFGPNLTAPYDPRRLVDSGATRPEGAITVYQNPLWDGGVALLPAAAAVSANGSSDTLPELSAGDVGPNQPVIMGSSASTVAGAPAETVLDDGIRRRDFGFGGISQYSDTLTAHEPLTGSRAAHDYLPTPHPPLSTVAYLGIRGVSASSSGSDSNAVRNVSPANSAWSAIDGRRGTAWRTGRLAGAVGAWWQVNLLNAVVEPTISMAFVGSGPAYPDRIRVDTAAGSQVEGVFPDGLAQPVALPAGATTFIRVTILGIADGSPGYAAGIRTVSLPGIVPARTLSVPNTTTPDVMSFAVADGHRPPCLSVAAAAVCRPSFPRRAEEDASLDRSFNLPAAEAYRVRAGVHLKPGPSLDSLLDGANRLRAIASSTSSADPRVRAGAAVDGNDETGWVAAVGDVNPALTIATKRVQRLRGLVITPISDSPTTRPVRVAITAHGRRFVRRLPPNGRLRFPTAVSARSVTIVVLKATLRNTTSSLDGSSQLLPVGIGEVRLLGRDTVTASAPQVLKIGCASGLSMTVDGTVVPLELAASADAVLQGSSLAARPCRQPSATALSATRLVLLNDGPNRLTLGSSRLSRPQSLVLTRAGYVAPSLVPKLPMTTLNWSATHRSVRVQATQSAVLVVHENANAGWRATVNGTRLASVMVDGWEQAWLVPSGTVGVVHLVYTPQALVTAGLVAGGGAVLVLLLLLLVPALSRQGAGRALPRPIADGALGGVAAWIAVAACMTALGSSAGLLITVAIFGVARVFDGALVVRKGPWIAGGLLCIVAAVAALWTASSGHPLAGSPGEQLLCLTAIGVVLTGALLPVAASPRRGEPSQQRPLEQVPARGGDGRGGEDSEDE
jgi:arabinofuranan 3-O-arabinosyltransferase